MRTTITLDDDVAAHLEWARKARRAGLKEVLNEALRRGLPDLVAPPRRPPTPNRTPSVDLGRCLVGSLDDVAQALAIVEGEGFR